VIRDGSLATRAKETGDPVRIWTRARLLEALRASDHVDKVRCFVEFVLQALMKAVATEALGTAPDERNENWPIQCMGTNPVLSTLVDDVELAVTKPRGGSVPRRRIKLVEQHDLRAVASR